MLRLWSSSSAALVARRRAGHQQQRPLSPTLVESVRSLCLQPTRLGLGGAGRWKTKKKDQDVTTPPTTMEEEPPTSAAAVAIMVPPVPGFVASPRPAPMPRAKAARKTKAATAAGATRQRRQSVATGTGKGTPPQQPTVIRIDVGQVLSEWSAVQRLGSDSSSAGGDSTSGGASTMGNTAQMAAGMSNNSASSSSPVARQKDSIADRAAAMSAILRHPDLYPQLHTLFFLDKDSNNGSGGAGASRGAADQFSLTLDGTVTVVRSESSLAALLFVMRVYRQLSRRSPWMAKVYRELGVAILAELSVAWEAATGSSDAAADNKSNNANTKRKKINEKKNDSSSNSAALSSLSPPVTAASVKRSTALVLLEVHRGQFAQAKTKRRRAQAAAAADDGTGDAAAAEEEREAAVDDGDWSVAAVRRFLDTTVAAVAVHVAAGSKTGTTTATTGTVGEEGMAELTTDYALLVLAATLGDAAVAAAAAASSPENAVEVPLSPSSSPLPSAAWWEASTAVRARLAAQVAASTKRSPVSVVAAHDGGNATPTAAQQQQQQLERRVEDALEAMLVCQQFDIVVPNDLRQYLHGSAVRVLQAACNSVRHQPQLFSFLCSPVFAARLYLLKDCPGSLYQQLYTDVFAAAGTFLAVSGSGAVMAMLEEREADRWQANTSSASASSIATITPPQRPTLHTPLAHLCYLLMLSGFSPDAVLGSGLCMSLAAVDLADTAAAAALFSGAFAWRPLPVRVHCALNDEAVALSRRARVMNQRAVQTATEMMLSETAGLTSLRTRLEAGAAAAVERAGRPRAPGGVTQPPRPPTPAQRQRLKRLNRIKVAAAAEAESAVGADADTTTTTASSISAVASKAEAELLAGQAYYVAAAALVEGMCRGDTAGVTRILQAHFPLLEVEGSAAYLVQSLELVTARLGERFSSAGSLEGGGSHNSSSVVGAMRLTVTTLAMEQCFAEVACAYQSRLSDSILRQTLKLTSANAGRGGGGGGGSSSSSYPVSLTAAATSKDDIDDLMALVHRFTSCALTLGMKLGFHEQLTALHTTLLGIRATAAGGGRGSGSGGGSAKEEAEAARDAFRTVKGLNRLLGSLADGRLPAVARHPQSASCRSSGIALNRIVAVQLHATAGVAAALGSSSSQLLSSTSSAEATAATLRRQRTFILSVVNLLFRLATDHPVEAEPIQLQSYRTEILDPALALVLGMSNGGININSSSSSIKSTEDALPLSTLTEVAVVMCVRRTIHNVSLPLFASLSQSTVRAVSSASVGSGGGATSSITTTTASATTGAATSMLAQRLLCAAATVCLRSDPTLTSHYLAMAAELEPALNPRQAIAVLDAALELRVPPSAVPITRMRQKLTDALAVGGPTNATTTTATSGSSNARRIAAAMPPNDTVAALRTLCRFDERVAAISTDTQQQQQKEKKEKGGSATTTTTTSTTDVAAAVVDAAPYGAALLRLCRPETLRRRPLGLRQCGQLVWVAASLRDRPEVLAACTAEERECIVSLPWAMAVPVLQSPHSGAERDMPTILTGYARLRGGRGGVSAGGNDANNGGGDGGARDAAAASALCAQVTRAFISRVIRGCPLLAPEEVVECVEALCAAGVYHEYLFSVLLGRVADVTQNFSLELSLRLLHCASGTTATSSTSASMPASGGGGGHPQVRLACLTAAQPVFVSHVRHLLHSDPHQLVTVGSTSTTILICLRDCFPTDPISAAVLETIAAHHASAGMAVTMAALELTAARGSRDYAVLRALADHCTGTLLPVCTADEAADLVCILVACGVRSGALMAATSARFAEVAGTAGGYALARLAAALDRACVDVDAALTERTVGRVAELVDGYLDAVEGDSPAVVGAKGEKKTAAAANKNIVSGGGGGGPPFTTPQAAAILRHLRTAGKLHFATVTPAVDALLTYLGVLWALSAAATKDAADAATATATAIADAQVQAPVVPAVFSAGALTPAEIEAVLSACIDQASEPRRHGAVVDACVAQLCRLLAPPPPLAAAASTNESDDDNDINDNSSSSEDDSAAPTTTRVATVQSTAWCNDLALLVSLANHLVRATTTTIARTPPPAAPLLPGTAAFAAAHGLFDLLYERRAALLRRQLLLETVRQTLTAAGKEVSPPLHSLTVEKKILPDL